MTEMQDAPSFHRNKEPMLDVLNNLLAGENKDVLEIASGSGQHGPFFTEVLPNLTWWPSDISATALASINAWREHLKTNAVKQPHLLDVTSSDWRDGTDWPEKFDCILSMNMIHISPHTTTSGLIEGASKHLRAGGKLVLYGPFKQNGKHTAPSNEAFDQSLKDRDSSWGIRDLEGVVEIAKSKGLSHMKTIEMPANNLVVIFER